MPLPEQSVRGVKRKRPSDGGKSEVDNQNLETKLHRKLYHAVRDLRKVVKKARTFEVQKTLKKLKDARHKDPESDTTKHLVAQMEILKHLRYDELAQSALMTKLKKDKALCTDPTIQAISVQLVSNLIAREAPGTPMAKVQSRILSSKVLASEVLSIVESLRVFLHTPAESEDVGDAMNKLPTLSNTSKKRRAAIGHEKGTFTLKESAAEPSDEGSDGYENTSGDEAAAELDDDWESGTVNTASQSDDFKIGAADDHESSSHDASEADFLSEDARHKQSQPHGSKGQSEFLPSLSVGFIRGDSDSEFSESELKLSDGIKKNRRGQRARRAIWEKKFGKNANHVKKRKQQDKEHRQAGPVPSDRRSGKGNASSRRRRTPIKPGASGGPRSDGAEKSGLEPHSGKTGLREERPLHPSWEAKRKQKSASIVPSQGTKIVFSDP